MGAMCTPNYANAFTGKFEKTYVYPYIRSFGKKALPLKKTISKETSKLAKHIQELKQAFIKRDYEDQFLNKQFDRLPTIEESHHSHQNLTVATKTTFYLY